MTTEEFYHTDAWKKKRKYILKKRDKERCQLCKRYGRMVQATMVHHIKPLDEYPELGLVNSNLISLCDSCHNKQHPEKGGYRKGRRYV